jgi:hypothetical protein
LLRLEDIFVEDGLGSSDDVDEVAESDRSVSIFVSLLPQLLCDLDVKFVDACIVFADVIECLFELKLVEGRVLIVALACELV